MISRRDICGQICGPKDSNETTHFGQPLWSPCRALSWILWQTRWILWPCLTYDNDHWLDSWDFNIMIIMNNEQYVVWFWTQNIMIQNVHSICIEKKKSLANILGPWVPWKKRIFTCTSKRRVLPKRLLLLDKLLLFKFWKAGTLPRTWGVLTGQTWATYKRAMQRMAPFWTSQPSGEYLEDHLTPKGVEKWSPLSPFGGFRAPKTWVNYYPELLTTKWDDPYWKYSNWMFPVTST